MCDALCQLTSGNCSQLNPVLMIHTQVPLPKARSSKSYVPGLGRVKSRCQLTRLRCSRSVVSSVFIVAKKSPDGNVMCGLVETISG